MSWYDQFDIRKFFDPAGLATTPTNHAPTQYQDAGKLNGFIDQGMLGLTNQAVPQSQAANMGQGAQLELGNDPFRAAQLRQMGQLQGIASGQQQGAGELAAQRQYANAQAAQQAMARSQRGPMAGLAYRNAANQSAALGSSAAGAGQQAALQDQMGAQGLLGQVGAAGRGADIGVAGQNAGFQQQAAGQNAGFQQQNNLANAQLQQQGQQMNSNNYMQLLNQLAQLNQTKYNADVGVGVGQNQAAAASSGGLLSGLGGAMALFSDERLKTDVSDASDDIDEMLDALSPKSGRYKDRKHGEGEWTWVMAQDLRKSRAGARMVQDTDDGLAVDAGKAISTLLAAGARLNKRLRKLEER